MLAVLLAVSLCVQIFLIPQLAAQTVALFPEAESLRVPGIIGCVALVVCAQAALLAVWRILPLVGEGGNLQPAASGPVNVLIGSGIAAVAVLLVAFVILTVAQSMPPAAMIIIVLGVLGGSALTIAALAMRGRLRRESAPEREVGAVI